MIQLPPLPYPYDALQPALSERTLETHHDKHQAHYVETTNALARKAGRPTNSLEDLIRDAASSENRELFNNAAQAWNHAFFWICMTPERGRPGPALSEAIAAQFGGEDSLRQRFIEEGGGHFGSGWVWLAAEGGRLKVFSTHDAGTAALGEATPLLVCDLWEHAYYLDHRNDRAGFLALWWDRLANWDFADHQFAAHLGAGAPWAYPREVESYVAPLGDHHAFERALVEAGMLLEDPPTLGTEHDRRFGGLLKRIAEYEPDAPAVGQAGGVSADLDRRIRAAARRSAEQHPDDSHHWSPLVGGDVGHEGAAADR